MQKLFALLLIVLITTASRAQTFEGKIVYSISFQSRVQTSTNQQLADMMGNQFDYYYKADQYKTISNGTLFQWQLYSPTDHKLYSKMSGFEAAFWDDATVNRDSVFSAEVHPRVIEILGYTCDELVLKCKTGVQKYYYSSKISIDPSLFEKDPFGNWYEYLKISKALPLKMVIESEQFIMTSTAVKVEPMKLESALFTLPAGLKTEKNPL